MVTATTGLTNTALTNTALTRTAWDVAATVTDPEIPVISIADLGVLRSVEVTGEHVDVTITPTYSGCPAMDAIRADVEAALAAAGFDDVSVRLVLAPAWTTDWITDEGKRKLHEYGIAPPTGRAAAGLGKLDPREERDQRRVRLTMSVKCPRCDSLHTRELARFGSTSCKALYECLDCLEPFDYFKVL
ncbi:1,2-phenylacetyl-CoA epoxidase subunit PaaD [Diaminobutyricimonas sp. TR449]|uniref:1,2-phenylacetyl-CoA epoxidase subunit PaaD n=1 Tax=Diaminobutyricimonas sp. TR449 TaxID=2708076 RepID=UPI0014226BDB|nr:1,2-phenylacetyl-CoA epoxidase subunit PaaD [Diaminobutyricimonas sp. TR449]